jgi:hypothetical protein
VAMLVLVAACSQEPSRSTQVLAPVPFADFETAWRRAAAASAELTGTTIRNRADQVVFQRTVRRLQRDGEWVTSEDGTVTALLDDQLWTCDPDTGCSSVGRATDVVASELAVFESLVTGADPEYELNGEGACYAFDARRTTLRPPVGERTRFCFDPTTGALIERREERDGTVTVTELTVVTAVVDDVDMRLPELESAPADEG